MKDKIQRFTVNYKESLFGKQEGHLAFPEFQITVEGCGAKHIADGIVRMLENNQCAVCGALNGLHRSVFHVTSMDNGEVNGQYLPCENGLKGVQ